ncbi:MAG: hypothetical protein IT301_04575 [Dehalococcoidia bacterium]|nr:hypothetical protein [Dehalococcoidia bacterium]
MNQDELRAEIDRLMERDELEAASRLIDQLEQIDADEFMRRLNAAPVDDEPVSPAQRSALDRAWEMIRGAGAGRVRSAG